MSASHQQRFKIKYVTILSGNRLQGLLGLPNDLRADPVARQQNNMKLHKLSFPDRTPDHRQEHLTYKYCINSNYKTEGGFCQAPGQPLNLPVLSGDLQLSVFGQRNQLPGLSDRSRFTGQHIFHHSISQGTSLLF